ncbi:MAG: cytidylate kinase family protein [Alphaproteobacteria bacterium]|nr:cytidylate kinase family protein [Alphaproteobacteria bacterium]
MAIITISGDLGSGKTSVSKILIEKLGYERFSVGDAWRKVAENEGVSILELNKRAEKDKSIDLKVDNEMIEVGKTMDNLVIDSRLAWHFIPHSFKVMLKVNPEEAARRIAKDTERKGCENFQDLKEAAQSIVNRRKSEVERFKIYYQVDIEDENNFDIVIDTTNTLPEQIAQEIIAAAKAKGAIC